MYRRDTVRRILDDHFALRQNYDNEIWALMSFTHWHRDYIAIVGALEGWLRSRFAGPSASSGDPSRVTLLARRNYQRPVVVREPHDPLGGEAVVRQQVLEEGEGSSFRQLTRMLVGVLVPLDDEVLRTPAEGPDDFLHDVGRLVVDAAERRRDVEVRRL